MSFGFKVLNSKYSITVDEEHPLYMAPSCRVTQTYITRYTGARNVDEMQGGWTQDMIIGVDLTYTFLSAVSSIPQPLLFMAQSHPANVTDSYYLGRSAVWKDYVATRGTNTNYLWGAMDGWLSNIRFIPLGSPGSWTGMHITLRSLERQLPSPKYPEIMYNAIRAHMPDYRNKFLIAGAGVSDGGDTGCKVWDSSGRLVFNSNSNMINVQSQSSGWDYLNRYGGGGTYLELWRSHCAATSGADWGLVIPRQTVRRYNGEIAQVAMAHATGRPYRFVTGGRSGSAVHTPMMYVRPYQPIWYS